MIPDWLQSFNTFAWITSNILVAYVSVVLAVFVIAYYILFDPRATTAGKLFFRFAFSLIGVIGLVFISLFVDPHVGREWITYPGDPAWWRPGLRLVIYSQIAYTVSSLTVFLTIRKWWPSKVKTSLDREVVQVRNETRDIPIIK